MTVRAEKCLNRSATLKVIEKYGADALRFTLATGNSPGNDMRYYESRVEASRNFANKIWNASRFLLMNISIDKIELPSLENLKIEDKWILNKYNRLVKEVSANLEKFELGVAASKLYDFIWDDYCDWYIELVKPRLYEKDGVGYETAQSVLAYVLLNTLKLLHPFMPFITEEIFTHLPTGEESIMISKWPEADSALSFDKEEEQMENIMEAIKSIRNVRTKMNVAPSRKAKVFIVTDSPEIFKGSEVFFEKLASSLETVIVSTEEGIPENAVTTVVDNAKIFIPFGDLVDIAAEKERLTKEKEHLISEIKRVEGKLNNAGFVAKAPQKVVDEERAKGEKYNEMLEKVEESLKNLE